MAQEHAAEIGLRYAVPADPGSKCIKYVSQARCQRVPVDAFKSLRIPSWKLEAYSPNGGVRNYSNEEDHQHKVRCNTQRVERFPIARLSCPLKDMVVHVQVVVHCGPQTGSELPINSPRVRVQRTQKHGESHHPPPGKWVNAQG